MSDRFWRVERSIYAVTTSAFTAAEVVVEGLRLDAGGREDRVDAEGGPTAGDGFDGEDLPGR
jgi:hypothetical protein